MKSTALSSEKFDSNAFGARMAARFGPVLVSDDGSTTSVLLSIDQFKQITQDETAAAEAAACLDVPVSTAAHPTDKKDFLSIVELLAMPGAEDIDFDPPRSREVPRGWDFS